uniref:TM2 domain-containing protein n=2 Tax=Tetranychus urticae TaxID=32264 RepID=T1K0D6_TETUR
MIPEHAKKSRKLIPADCSQPLVGQYVCSEPIIDPTTQQPVNCDKNNKAKVNCTLRDGFYCDGQEKNVTTFLQDIDCLYTNGYYFETALLLSIFLGMFGADRFYLGYPAIGLLKLCTFGCFFILQFIDVILIALQVLKPVDNSNYIIRYYGPRLNIVHMDNNSWPLNKSEL